MSTAYTEANEECRETVANIIRRLYPDLRESDATFTLLFAMPSELGERPLKKNGYPCLALIKVNSLADRAAGLGDVTIKIDGPRWDEMREVERDALIDHELYHLVIKRDKKTRAIKRDDLGRPKIGTRPHDFEVGGFQEVIERHKQEAHEAKHLHACANTYLQGVFPWG